MKATNKGTMFNGARKREADLVPLGLWDHLGPESPQGMDVTDKLKIQVLTLNPPFQNVLNIPRPLNPIVD